MSRRQKDLFPKLPDGKRYVSDIPELAAEWHPTKNKGKRPEDFFFDAAAPAPVWALGAPNTAPFPALIDGSIWKKLEPFSPISGMQKILIPKHINAFYQAAIITWCTIVNVPLGEGRITQR